MVIQRSEIRKPNVLAPEELREIIKEKAPLYLSWLRQRMGTAIARDDEVLDPKHAFIFSTSHRFLNFHPSIQNTVQDLLKGSVDREYGDVSPDIAIHDYIGHVASSQALCWNVALIMKKHDNFAPLFGVLREALDKEGMASEWDFGIETAVVLELNAGMDLGENGKVATSVDLYLRTAQGKVCAIEFKLTEPDFGRCKLPGTEKCDGNYGSPDNINLS